MHVLIIGATGMLGRPVARQLTADGFQVRALVRNPEAARKILPTGVELHSGDLRDSQSLLAALRGVDAVYLNLAAPMRRSAPKWDPELDGARAVVEAARQAGVKRLLRISALGVEEAVDRWWSAKHKYLADHAVMESSLNWTVFRPTWLMESLATLKLPGPFIMSLNIGDAPLRWIAGEDFARQVSAAIAAPASYGRTYVPQGPELLTIGQAVRRFARAWPRKLFVVRAPMPVMRLGSLVSGKAHYLTSLLRMTRDEFSRLDQQAFPTDLPQARMTVEQYVESIRRTGDMPRK